MRFLLHVMRVLLLGSVGCLLLLQLIAPVTPSHVKLLPNAAWIAGLIETNWNFLRELAPSLVAAVIVFLIGFSWKSIAAAAGHWRARFFWGKGLLTGEMAICHGTLTDTRLAADAVEPYRYKKTLRDGRCIQVAGPRGGILGECEVRSVSYLVHAISQHRKSPVHIESGTTGYKHLNRTAIALGSPASNELTEIVMNEDNNVFLAFSQGDGGEPRIVDKIANTYIERSSGEVQKDYGVVLKIKNVRFPGHFFFVCADLGEWGTSGAAWYLSNGWKKLDNLGEQFGVIVEVEIGADESARQFRMK